MIPHSLPFKTIIGDIETAIAPIEYVPSEIEAIVEEQDTQLLMVVDSVIDYPEDDFDTLIDQMSSGKSRKPGQIIVRHEKPMRLQAIIHDIYQEPSCKVEWVAFALKQLIEEINNLQIKTLAMPLLGTIQGKIAEQQSVELLCACLGTDQKSVLEKLWLVVPDPVCSRIKQYIENMN